MILKLFIWNTIETVDCMEGHKKNVGGRLRRAKIFFATPARTDARSQPRAPEGRDTHRVAVTPP